MKTRIIPIEVSRLLKILKAARSDERPYILAFPFPDGRVDFLAMSTHTAVFLTARNAVSASLIGFDGDGGLFDLATKVEGLIRIPSALMNQSIEIPDPETLYAAMERPASCRLEFVANTADLAAFLSLSRVCIDTDRFRRTIKECLTFGPTAYKIESQAEGRPNLLLVGELIRPEMRIAYSFRAMFCNFDAEKAGEVIQILHGEPADFDLSNPFEKEPEDAEGGDNGGEKTR